MFGVSFFGKPFFGISYWSKGGTGAPFSGGYFGKSFFGKIYFGDVYWPGGNAISPPPGTRKIFGVTIYRGLSKAMGVIEAEGVTIIRSIIDNE